MNSSLLDRTSRRKRGSIFLAATALALSLLVFAPAASSMTGSDWPMFHFDADDPTYVGEPPPCGTTGLATLSVIDCVQLDPVPSLDDEASPDAAGTAASAAVGPVFDPGLPPNCRIHLEAVFYAATDWLRLGQRLAADPSPCADYYISIPPLAADKTRFRVLQDDLIRALGPRFHPVAEINVTGWSAWVQTNKKTWTDAGIEARRRMADAGYEIASGETWALNELSSAVRRNAGAARANMRAFIGALHDGDGALPMAKGIVFVIGLDQALPDVSVYKATMQSWLQDGAFWSDMARDVRWWAQEVYPNSFNWAVVGAPRAVRAQYFNDYLQHPLILAEAGPASVQTARSFLESSYTALTSAAWRWPADFGNTDITQAQMNNFVSEELFSVRHYVGSNPQTIPQGFVGTAWAPRNLTGLTAPEFAAQTRAILERLASALHQSYEQGGSSQEGACGPPGEHIWCDEEVEGAVFNDAWKAFAEW
jgi:hypothetical protein